MQSSSLALVVTALLVGVGSSVATVAVLGPSELESGGTSSASAADVDALRRLVDTLREGQLDTQRRVQALQLELLTQADRESDGAGAPEPLAASHNELQSVQKQIAALSERLEGDSATPFAIETVSAALDAIREREDKERDERREAERLERAQERLEQLTKELGLDGYQQGQVQLLMADSDVKRDEIMGKARDSGDFGGLRDSFDSLRTEMETRLGTFLTPSQLSKLEELGGTRSISGWGRGPGGDRGFGGGFPGFGGGRGNSN